MVLVESGRTPLASVGMITPVAEGYCGPPFIGCKWRCLRCTHVWCIRGASILLSLS